MLDPRRDPSGVACSLILLCLLSNWTVRSESGESDHGLASEKTPILSSPAMAGFFQGSSSSSSDLALPEARNVTDTVWSLTADAAPGGSSNGAGNRRDPGRTALMAAGVVGAVAGVGMLAAAVVYMQKRRSKAAVERLNGGQPGSVRCPMGA